MASIKDLKRMCITYDECKDCPLSTACGGYGPNTFQDNADEIVDKWIQEHPARTYAMDFFEKFPNADREPDTDEPAVCRCRIYGGDCHNSDCTACWNMEMIEQ